MGIRLDLGSGPIPFRDRPGFDYWKDSKTLDIVQWKGKTDIVTDASKEIPLKNNSVDAIICVEVIEHIGHQGLGKFLSEIYRILKKDGTIRIQCPNFESISHGFMDAKSDPYLREYCYLCITGRQESEFDLHRNIFTRTTLEKAFRNHGFKKIEEIKRPVVVYPGVGWQAQHHLLYNIWK